MINKSIVIASLVAVGVMSSASASAANCSLKTLKGAYIYNSQGTLNNNPYAESGKEVYDGKGNVAVVYTANDGSSGSQTGTYTINEYCNGTTTYQPSGDVYHFYASPKGDSFSYISGAANATISGIETRVSK